jgi:hypothetical protein
VTLLTYSLATVPDPLQAGEQGTLELTVQNASRSVPVTLTELDVTFPLGSDAGSLCASSVGIATVKPDDSWTVDHDEGSSVFKFCAPVGGVAMKGQSISLRLEGIAVNDTPGTTVPVDVTAYTGDPKDPVTESWSSQELQKFPAQFSLSDVTQDPTTAIAAGGDVTLNWTGTSDPAYPPAYTLDRSDRTGDPSWPADVGPSGPLDVTDLTPDGEFVLFTLMATIAVPNQPKPLVYQKQHTVQVLSPVPLIQQFDAGVDLTQSPPQLTVHWNVANLGSEGSVVIPELSSTKQFYKGKMTVGVTAAAPLPTTLTLCAYPPEARRASAAALGDAAPVTQTKRPQWTQTAANPAAATSGNSLYELFAAGDVLYAAQGSAQDETGNLRVLDARSLEVLSDVPPSSESAPSSIAVSADGTRLFVSGSYQTPIYVYDATQSPPQPLGQPVPTDGAYNLVFVPGGVTPYGDVLLAVSTSGSVVPYPVNDDPQQPLGSPTAGVTLDSSLVVALSTDGRHLHGLTSDIDDVTTTMQVLDLATMQAGPAVPVPYADAIAAAPGTRAAATGDGSVVVYHDQAGRIHRLDPAAFFAVEATSNQQVFAGVRSADGRTVYGLPFAAGAIVVYDAGGLDAVGSIPYAPGRNAPLLAASADGLRLYAGAGANVTLFTPSGYA